MPGRAVAAHLHRGVPHGIVVISAYFKDGEGLGQANSQYLWTLVQYVCQLNSQQQPWIMCADWNMDLDVLTQSPWLEFVQAVSFLPNEPTCRQVVPGTTIDYFIACRSLSARLGPHVSVDETASTFPHLPVSIPVKAADSPMWTRVAHCLLS